MRNGNPGGTQLQPSRSHLHVSANLCAWQALPSSRAPVSGFGKPVSLCHCQRARLDSTLLFDSGLPMTDLPLASASFLLSELSLDSQPGMQQGVRGGRCGECVWGGDRVGGERGDGSLHSHSLAPEGCSCMMTSPFSES